MLLLPACWPPLSILAGISPDVATPPAHQPVPQQQQPSPSPTARFEAGRASCSGTYAALQDARSASYPGRSRPFVPTAVFVEGKQKRPLLVVSCAVCGCVVGFDLLWTGAPETSDCGFRDVLRALEKILSKLGLDHTPRPAIATNVSPAATALNQSRSGDGSNSASAGLASEGVLMIYNDALGMLKHMKQLGESSREQLPTTLQHLK